MNRQWCVVGCCFCLIACGSDKAVKSDAGGGYFGDFDSGTAGQEEDASGAGNDAGNADGLDGALESPLSRGRYLVHHAAACVECHTPRDAVGRLDESRALSGVECLRDADPEDDSAGCLHSGNLTNHETGLKNRADVEIKAMFLEGMRPNGKALHPIMPYWVLGNMSESDADAIVAYLRTVPPIDHMVPPNQGPYDNVAAPTARWPKDALPQPQPEYKQKAAAQRGRYIAASLGSCIECHTPRNADGTSDTARAFRGGVSYPRDELLLPAAFFPPLIYSANLTPHTDGLAGWTVTDVVKALKDGRDREGNSLCPPMAGGMGAFGGLTQADAEDIAHYLLSLPPGEGKVVDECKAPF